MTAVAIPFAANFTRFIGGKFLGASEQIYGF